MLAAVQVDGGYGYCLGSPARRHLRDVKLWEIGAGTSGSEYSSVPGRYREVHEPSLMRW
ncbi:MAG: hypothetical protein KBG12_07885 [Syntrophobacterales bacterium]|nr:hypothetical protein [Syntrophobacterales bacterium]